MKAGVDIGPVAHGARVIGLGKAFTAVSDDTNAVFSNPAGLGFQKGWSVLTMSTQLLHRVDYKLYGGSLSTNSGTFAIAFAGASTPAGFYTTDLASLNSATPISYSSNILFLSYGYDLNNSIRANKSMGHLAFGVNLKILTNGFSGISNAQASGFDMDIGVLMKKNDNLTLGAAVRNLLTSTDGGAIAWDSGTTERLPSVIALGGSYSRDKFLLACDLNISKDSPLLIHAGVEYKPTPLIALRVGLEQDAYASNVVTNNITLGAGINYKGVSFDYAYRMDSNLEYNSCHYFSISYKGKQ